MSEEIITANEKDANTLSQLGRTTYVQGFADLFVGYEADLEAYLEKTFGNAKIYDSLRQEDNVFLLAYDGDKPIGYAKLKKSSAFLELEASKPMQLQKIYVLSDYIGKQVGASLLTKVLAIARAEKADQVWLFVVQSNTRACCFYERFGFKRVGAHAFTIGSQEFHFHVMSLPL